jgi:hypothetical protein
MNDRIPTARQFAQLHRKRDDSVGDFCRDLLLDRDFPRGRPSWKKVKEYLYEHGACDGAIRAAAKFWALWQGRPLP